MRRRYARWDIDAPRPDEASDESGDDERVSLGLRLSRAGYADRRSFAGRHLEPQDRVLSWLEYDPAIGDTPQVELSTTGEE